MPSPVPGLAPSWTTASPVATAARTERSRLLVRRELVDRVEDPQPRAHGALGIVLVGHGRAEDGHYGVADELLHRAAVPLDLAGDAFVVGAERGAHVLGVRLVGAGREADEVDEEHGDDLALLAGRRRLERRAAGEAEARALRVLLAAVRADDHRASVRTWHKADTSAKDRGGYVRGMDEARSVLRRLERIEALERRGSPAELMLAELRELVAEAEAWVRVEPGPTDGAEDAIERLRQAVADPESTRRTLLA